MPSKKHIINKINELDKELTKLKAWCFEHYCLNGQETKEDV